MQFSFNYSKNKVIQALRYHFIKQNEIRILVVVVNVFTIISAILFATGKIQPQPFFIGTLIWLLVLIGVWYVLPYSIYAKTEMFKRDFIAHINEFNLLLETEQGTASFEWKKFTKWFETEHFFHLYLDSKSFFLIPKNNLSDEWVDDLRFLMKKNIS